MPINYCTLKERYKIQGTLGGCTLATLVEGSTITPDKTNEIRAALEAPPSTDDKREARINSFNLIPLFTQPSNRLYLMLDLFSLLRGILVIVIMLRYISVSQLWYNIIWGNIITPQADSNGY